MRVKPVHIFCIRKQWWQIALTAFLALGMFLVVASPPFVGASATQRQLPIYCVERDQKMVSVSFDAAWGNVRVRPGNCKGAGCRV